MTTARCCGCGPGGTGTWAGPRTRPRAGSTPCCGLVPGGVPEEITAAQATRILDRSTPSGAAGQARFDLAAELLADMRRLDAQIREPPKKLAVAVKASPPTLPGLSRFAPLAPPPLPRHPPNAPPYPPRL